MGTPRRPDQIHTGSAFSSIARCPLEISRLVAPPVGVHRVRIAPRRGVRVARVGRPAPVLDEDPATRSPVISIAASRVTARNAASIAPRPTGGHHPGALERAAPECATRSPTPNGPRAASTATTATPVVPNVVPGPPAPDETARPVERALVMTEHRVAATPGHAERIVTSRTPRRRALHDPTIAGAARRSARGRRVPRAASTPRHMIVVPVCRRGIDHRVVRAPSADLVS
jgi:hypothetical protein